MDKNSIIGFVLIAAVLFGFTFYQSKQAKKQAELQAQLDSIALAEKIARGEIDTSAAATAAALEYEQALATESVAAEVGAKSAKIFKDSALDAAYNAEAQILALENDKFKVEFTTKGAQPYSVLIKDYYNYDSTALYVFHPDNLEYNISVYTGEFIQTKDFNFVVTEQTDSTLVMRLPFSGGKYIEQRWAISKGSYKVDNTLSFIGEGLVPRNVSSFDIDFRVTMPRMEKGYKNETQYSKLNFYYEGDKKPVELGRGRNGSKRVERFDWFACQQQFFSAIMSAPDKFASGELAVEFFPEADENRNLMHCSALMRADLKPNRDNVIPFEFYFGPNHFKTLKSFDKKYEKIIPLGGWLVGWFTRYAIIPMFDFFSRFIKSYGLIILLMTIVIKIVVFPLTYKSLASSAKMAALKPEIEKINKKYPKQEDAMKKQQATMDLYKRANVSMMGGCLPMFLTFPILWAMFRFFPASIELRQQPFLWCHDLSAYDSIVDFGSRIPILGDHISLFALLMAVTMFIYSKFTMNNQAAASDPSAQSMQFMTVWMMPIMMFFICNNLSAALSYYYLLSQLISIIQTLVIRKSVNKEELLAKVRASEGKPLPKSKWQQRLEEAQRLQEQQMKQQRRR